MQFSSLVVGVVAVGLAAYVCFTCVETFKDKDMDADTLVTAPKSGKQSDNTHDSLKECEAKKEQKNEENEKKEVEVEGKRVGNGKSEKVEWEAEENVRNNNGELAEENDIEEAMRDDENCISVDKELERSVSDTGKEEEEEEELVELEEKDDAHVQHGANDPISEVNAVSVDDEDQRIVLMKKNIDHLIECQDFRKALEEIGYLSADYSPQLVEIVLLACFYSSTENSYKAQLEVFDFGKGMIIDTISDEFVKAITENDDPINQKFLENLLTPCTPNLAMTFARMMTAENPKLHQIYFNCCQDKISKNVGRKLMLEEGTSSPLLDYWRAPETEGDVEIEYLNVLKNYAEDNVFMKRFVFGNFEVVIIVENPDPGFDLVITSKEELNTYQLSLAALEDPYPYAILVIDKVKRTLEILGHPEGPNFYPFDFKDDDDDYFGYKPTNQNESNNDLSKSPKRAYKLNDHNCNIIVGLTSNVISRIPKGLVAGFSYSMIGFNTIFEDATNLFRDLAKLPAFKDYPNKTPIAVGVIKFPAAAVDEQK